MKIFSTALLLVILAVCANAGDIVVTPGNLNGWSVTADTSANPGDTYGFVVGANAPGLLGTGSFQSTLVDGSSMDGAAIQTNNYSGLLLSAVSGLSYKTYDQDGQISNTQLGVAFNLWVDITLADGATGVLHYEPVYQTEAVTDGAWQSWNTMNSAGGNSNWWLEKDTNGSGGWGNAADSDTLAAYQTDFTGASIGTISLASGYGTYNPGTFSGEVDAFSIQANAGPCTSAGLCGEINDTVNFEPAPEPSTWASLGGGGLLLAGFELMRRRRAVRA